MVFSILLLARLVSTAPLLHINQYTNLSPGNSTLLENEVAQPWVAASSVRSSWEILYTCLTALLACFIKFAPLNFPAYGDSTFTKYSRKLVWGLLTVFIPELVLYRAWTQYQEAKVLKQYLDVRWRNIPEGERRILHHGRSRKSAKTKVDAKTESPTSRWLCHLAVSGGLVVDTSDIHDDLERMALRPNGLLELAKRGFFLSVTDRMLKDLRKKDDLGQAIALWQLAWLVTNVVARWANHLPVSLLELNTSVNILFALAFNTFWSLYTIDIAHPILVNDTEIREHITSFVEEPSSYAISRPMSDRISNIHETSTDDTPKIVLFLSAALAVHGALHLIAWNYSFPTNIERLLWRLSCFGLVLGLLPQLPLALRKRQEKKRAAKLARQMVTVFHVYWQLGPIPGEILSMTTTGIVLAMICSSSAYLFIESFLALRSSPVGVYERINWTTFLPSIG